MSPPHWIAVDWGTTNLRAWSMDEDGSVRAASRCRAGMNLLEPGARSYEATLLSLIGPWLSDDRRTEAVVCGMAGSRQGWIEAPYRQVPAPALGPNVMTEAPARDARLRVHIVQGVCQDSPPDVMRGEETALLGLASMVPRFDGTAVLPGTHHKWARIAQGEILRFRTFMTGELYGLLSERSILRHSVAAGRLRRDAFRQAFEEALARPEGAVARLFELRARHLLEDADPVEASSRLNGCLLGTEFASARDFLDSHDIAVIAAGASAERFRIALECAGKRFRTFEPETCVLNGLRAVRDSLAP